jgi:hypothetical protein
MIPPSSQHCIACLTEPGRGSEDGLPGTDGGYSQG